MIFPSYLLIIINVLCLGRFPILRLPGKLICYSQLPGMLPDYVDEPVLPEVQEDKPNFEYVDYSELFNIPTDPLTIQLN